MTVNSAMRAVITGGAGFLGSHLCDRMVSDGIDTVCVDNFCTGRLTNIEHLIARSDFDLVEADVSDRLEIAGPVDYVLHFASPASPRDYQSLAVETLKAGSVGTINALELALRKGARFLLASTSEVYGDPGVHPQPETYYGNVNPCGPRSMYDEAKRFSEAATAAYRQGRGLNAGIIRIFNVYGPRMRPNDGRVVPTLVNQALAGLPLTAFGDGSQTRSLCHVDDMVEGAMRMLRSECPGPINLGNPDEISIRDLADLVRVTVGTDSPVIFGDMPPDDPKRRCPDIRRASEQLGWRPTRDLADGLRDVVNWFAAERHDRRAVAPAG